MTTAEQNSAIFRDRWPDIWEWICDDLPDHDVRWEETSQAKTLVVNGFHLSSAYDPIAEARTQAAVAPPSASHVRIIGVGVGHLPRALLERPSLEHLEIIIISRLAFYRACAELDQSDWLTDPRVTLVRGDQLERVPWPVCVNPSALRLADQDCTNLAGRLYERLNTSYTAQILEQNPTIQERIRTAGPRIASAGDVAALFGKVTDGEIIVALGGPTLNDHLEWLAHRQRGGTPIIAASTAVKPLLAAGISPDITIAIDPWDGPEAHLTGTQRALRGRPLIVYPMVKPVVSATWQGPVLVAYPEGAPGGEQRVQALATTYPRGRLFSGGSVAHSAVDLARKMGAKTIVLAGADFSFAGTSQSHARGAAFAEEVPGTATDTVINGHGQRVQTQANLKTYLYALEDYIAHHQECQYILLDRRGARIQGTTYLDELEDV